MLNLLTEICYLVIANSYSLYNNVGCCVHTYCLDIVDRVRVFPVSPVPT